MRFSIITPVFNTEKFVGQCIESILGQTFNDFEMILINDCSTDNSLEVIKKYSCPKLRIVDLETNQGQASARNVGMDFAKGEYIMFVDSDDTLEPNALETINAVIEKHADVDLIKIKAPGIEDNLGLFSKVINSVDFVNEKIKVPKLLGYTWSMIWKRDKIKDFRHEVPRGMAAELPFNYMCFNATDKFYIVPNNLYNYNRTNSGSISKHPNYHEYVNIAQQSWKVISQYDGWKPEFYSWYIKDFVRLWERCLSKRRPIAFKRLKNEILTYNFEKNKQ